MIDQSLIDMTPVNEQALREALTVRLGDGQVVALKRLSGGANMETWSFDYADTAQVVHPLILRRQPGVAITGAAGQSADFGVSALSLETEAALLEAVAAAGVSVPNVVSVISAQNPLGPSYIMSRELGEALPQRLFTDPQYTAILPEIPFQAGAVLAQIHQVPLVSLPPAMPKLPLSRRLDDFQLLIDRYENSSPIHQIALDWLRAHEMSCAAPTLVHGDFRNGNLLIDVHGLSSVLDWELSHIGDPIEDLGYFCANVWRFGRYDKPAGGFGSMTDLLAGYASVAGAAPSVDELRYWELFAALNWGVITLTMLDRYRSGHDATLERAAVGRRMSESEIDILLLLDAL